MLEKHLEAKLVKECKRRGFLCYKFTSPSRRSVPDRMIINLSGVVLFMELKAKGKQPSPQQNAEIQKLRDQGCNAGWADTPKLAIQMLDQTLGLGLKDPAIAALA